MRFESLQDLKRELNGDPVVSRPVLRALGLGPRGGGGAVVAARLARRLDAVHTRPVEARRIALGVAKGSGRGDFHLGVRIHASARAGAALAEEIRRRARGEADIRFVPNVRRRVDPPARWFRRLRRPLEPGLSIGQGRDIAGTLGAIVEDGDAYYALSNNHVLADVNAAQPGATVSQPGDLDRRMTSATLIGVLDRFVPISFVRSNVVDCAVAQIFEDLSFYEGRFRGLAGSLRAPRPLTRDDLGRPVIKAGRTTGVTHGVINLVDVDGLRVDMSDTGHPKKEATFSDCVEVQGVRRAFSDSGDSGALIVDLDGHPRALLFCGTEDPDGPDLTYGNRIENVLGKLGVTMAV